MNTTTAAAPELAQILRETGDKAIEVLKRLNELGSGLSLFSATFVQRDLSISEEQLGTISRLVGRLEYNGSVWGSAESTGT